jgi:uncharacterized protein YfaS (alpha-2-macroglobulin family)
MKTVRIASSCLVVFLCLLLLGCNQSKPAPNVAAEPPYEGPLGEGRFEVKDSTAPVLGEARREQPEEWIRVGLIPPASVDAPLRLRFSEAIGSPGTAGDMADLKSPVINVNPPLERGRYEWKSDRELWIKLGGRKWAVNDEYEISVGGRSLDYYGRFTVGTFSLGAKTGEREVDPGNPAVVLVLNGDTELTGRNGAYILFDQPVTPAAVAVKCERGNGAKVGVALAQPEELPVAGGDVIDPEYVLYAKFSPALTPGETVTLSAGGRKSGRMTDYQLVVAPEFAVISGGFEPSLTTKTARLQSTFAIAFSTPVSLTSFRKYFAVAPAPRGLYTYQSENRFIMEMDLDVATDYTIGPAAAEGGEFTDILGQPLSRKKEFKFRSQDLDPYLQLPDKPLVLEAGQDRFPVKLRNPGRASIEVRLFKNQTDYIRSLKGEPPKNTAAYKVIETDLSSLSMNDLHTIDLSIDDKPGLKLVTVTVPGTGSEAARPLRGSLLVQTTAMGLSVKTWEGKVLGWATDLDSGRPAAGVGLTAVSNSGKVIASGTTGTDGVALLDVGGLATREGVSENFFLVAQNGGDRSITGVNDPDLSQAWQFNLPGIVKDRQRLDAALFTERGAYRPGEMIYFKLFARPLKDSKAANVNFVIRDPLGQKVFESTEALDDYWGAAGSYAAKEGAAVGEYLLEASVSGAVAQTTFRIEEYRVPTFSVKLTSSNRDFAIGQVVSVDAQAAYLHGGGMDGRRLEWRVYRQPDVFAPANFPGYAFGLAKDSALVGTVASGSGVLNAQSSFSLSFTPDHPPAAGLMKYIAEVAVTDVDRQTYAGRFSKSIHASDLYVGIKPPARAIWSEGSVLKLPYVVVDTEGKIVAGKKVEIQLNRVEYHTTAMENGEGSTEVYNRAVIETKTIGSEDSPPAPRELAIPLPGSGGYQVRLNVNDAKGRTASAEFLFTVSGGESSSWPRFDRERIDLIADKGEYKVGETAKIVAQTPYESAVGLLTLEANGVLERRIVEINKDTPAFEIPVKPEYAPNVYASLVLIRGRVHKLKDATGYETGAPGYKIGYAPLNVDPGERRLAVAVDAGAGSAAPGEKVTFTVSARDKNASPSNACAAVMVVDEGVLGLTGYKTPDPLTLAYKLRALGVRNTSNILDTPHSKRIRKEGLFPGGDSDIPGQMGEDSEALRKLFKSTVYWNPALLLGGDGVEKVTITLPDNLTTFRIMAVAVDQNGRMGSGEAALVSRKTLMVQAVAPRFVYPGDVLDLEAQVMNGSGVTGNVRLIADFKGLEILERPATEASLPGGKSRSFAYKVKVTGSAVEYSYRATMGAYQDGVEMKLPVLSPGNKITLVKSALAAEGQFVELELPRDIIPGTLKVEAALSGTPLSQLKDSVQYLMQYPNGCIEQTTSTAYPLIVLQDLLPSMGIDVNRADLKKFSEAGVKRILSFQTREGGLSYWPDGQTPHAFATAFGLTVLIEAKKRGYDVPSGALERMADFLEKSLREGTITGEMPHGGMADADTRALFVMTLGRLGRPQPGYIETLWSHKSDLTPFGLSFLALAIKESKTNTALLEPVLAAIKEAAKVSDIEAYYEAARKGGWSFDSPLRTHAGALMAYGLAHPDDEMTPKLLQGLLNRAQNGMWGNTQENVFGIMGIYQLVGGKTGAGDKLKAGIELNGKLYTYDKMEANSSNMMRITLPGSALGNNVTLLKARFSGGKGGSYYLTVRASFEQPLGDKFTASAAAGYTVKRIYETLDGKSLEGQPIPLGSLVRVRLLVKAAADQHYVAVDDKLPAGLEALNMALETTQTVDQLRQPSPAVLRTIPLISYHEIRDQRVAFYADEMLAGEYEFDYVAKAATPGTFLRPAGRTEAMYQTDFYGTTGMDKITVK